MSEGIAWARAATAIFDANEILMLESEGAIESLLEELLLTSRLAGAQECPVGGAAAGARCGAAAGRCVRRHPSGTGGG